MVLGGRKSELEGGPLKGENWCCCLRPLMHKSRPSYEFLFFEGSRIQWSKYWDPCTVGLLRTECLLKALQPLL